MNKIFVDTWAWYALADMSDHDHIVAQLANEALLDQAYTFVTTNFVLAETLTLIRYKIGHATAIPFRRILAGIPPALTFPAAMVQSYIDEL